MVPRSILMVDVQLMNRSELVKDQVDELQPYFLNKDVFLFRRVGLRPYKRIEWAFDTLD
jgi:hypothetical protein